jgi:predicted transposase YdaD
MIDHDRLFKELLSTFFMEFLELFLPEIAATLERDSLRFLPQEYFADLTTGEDKVIDLLVEVKQAGEDVGFLVHLEAQSSVEPDFPRRMFFYFARLHQKYLQRIYPIVVFSFAEPQREEPHTYRVAFPSRTVLEFHFESIQLNRLHWRDYLTQSNPVAAALMAKMRIAPGDRPKVKAECLRLLATLRLDPARTRLISGFVDTYLKLNQAEEQAFAAEIGRLGTSEREDVMEIVTSWMQQGIERGIEQGIERGIEQGIERGIEQGERSLILRQLSRRLGKLPDSLSAQLNMLSVPQLEALAEALLDFTNLADLEGWLQTHRQ